MNSSRMSFAVFMMYIFASFLFSIFAGDSLVKAADDSSNVEKLTLEDAVALRHQKKEKQNEFKETKAEALKFIGRDVRPGELLRQGNFTSVVMEYDGVPIPVYILLIAMIPLVLAELCRMLWNLVRPKLKFQQEGGGEFPFTACYHLQESIREQTLKRPARNCTSWFVHQYILAVEDETLEWRDVIESLQPAQPAMKKRPWQTIRLIFRLKNILAKTQKHNAEIKDDELEAKPILAGNHLQCHLVRQSSEDTLHLESQISELELHYKTLNALETELDIPSPPHPELFTVRELMEFMTRDEKLLILRCFDKSQMNELMINCNINEIRRKNADFVNAHLEAAASVYKHVDGLKNKNSAEKTQKKASEVVADEPEKSVEVLFEQKDQLAKEIVAANERLLEEFEASPEQNEVKENIKLEPIHIQKIEQDNNIEPEDILLIEQFDNSNAASKTKTKPLTSDERIEQLIQDAKENIELIKKKKKKRGSKKGRQQGKHPGENAAKTVDQKPRATVPAKQEKKPEKENPAKTPYKWIRKSTDEDEERLNKILNDAPKAEERFNLKGRKEHANLHDFDKDDKTRRDSKGKEKRKSSDKGKEERKVSGEEPGENRRKSGEETDEKKRKFGEGTREKRQTSGEEPGEKRKTSGEEPGDKRKTSGEEPREKRKTSGEEPGEKRKTSKEEPGEKRKTSGEEPGEKRKTSGEEPGENRRRSGEGQGEKKRKSGEGTGEKRKTSGEEPGEKRKISGEEPGEKRKISGEEPEEKRKTSREEPGENRRKSGEGHGEKKRKSGEGTGEKRRTSGEEPEEKRKTSEEPGENKRKSGEGHGEKKRKSGEMAGEKKRKSSGEKRKKRDSEDQEEREDDQRKPKNEADEGRKRKTSKNRESPKGRRRSSGKDHGESKKAADPNTRRTSDNEGNLIEPEDQKKPETEIAIQTHHRHHRNNSLPVHRPYHRRLHLPKEPDTELAYIAKGATPEFIRAQFDSLFDDDEDYKQKKKDSIKDKNTLQKAGPPPEQIEANINVVHEETVSNFLQKIENPNLTPAQLNAMKLNVMFQPSPDNPGVKIYRQGRREKFETGLKEHGITDKETGKQDQNAEKPLTNEKKVARKK